MPKSIAKILSNDLDDAREDVSRLLKRAARDAGDGMEDTVADAAAALNRAARALAEEARDKTPQVIKATAEEAKRHPMIAAAALATAAAALTGLVVATRRGKD